MAPKDGVCMSKCSFALFKAINFPPYLQNQTQFELLPSCHVFTSFSAEERELPKLGIILILVTKTCSKLPVGSLIKKLKTLCEVKQ